MHAPLLHLVMANGLEFLHATVIHLCLNTIKLMDDENEVIREAKLLGDLPQAFPAESSKGFGMIDKSGKEFNLMLLAFCLQLST